MLDKKNTILVGIGGYNVIKEPGKIIKTMALGSCVGITFYEPKIRIAGLVHIALPESKILLEKAKKLPGYFADTGILALIDEFKKNGVTNFKNVQVKIAGGANLLDPNNIFNIGKRNVLSVRKELWKNRIAIKREDIGGDMSRTEWIEVDTGNVYLSSPKIGTWEL